MSQPLRRSVLFTLQFNDTPVQPDLDCLSTHAAPADELELLCDGKQLSTYSRDSGSVTIEFLADAAPHTITLRTNGLVRLESSAQLPAGIDTCHLEGKEDEHFRLNLTEVAPPPADIEVNDYDTTYAVAEELVFTLLDWPEDLTDDCDIYIMFMERNVVMCTDSTWEPDYSFRKSYAELAIDRPDVKNYDRLSVKNRNHLQRYVYGYLRTHPELQHLNFHWESNMLRATAARSPAYTMRKLCNEIYHGRIAKLFDDMSVRFIKIIPEPMGFYIQCYDSYHPDAEPMLHKSFRYRMAARDLAPYGRSPYQLHNALAAALRRSTPPGSNIRTENWGDYIMVSMIEDPYFTFD